MAVKIRLKRMGKIHAPFYRVVVMDSRKKRDGRAIEEIGKYHPTREPSVIEIDSERAQYWLSVGAQPTDTVRKLLELTGDWAKYTGSGETASTVRTAEGDAEEATREAIKAAEDEAEKRKAEASAKEAEAKAEAQAAEEANDDNQADAAEESGEAAE
ncbi:MAG: 30S ribosomal protein S16 [Bowdeniella nasicola]|nr:30S ribosomal protein S16 [Bowdeniella nasicola]